MNGSFHPKKSRVSDSLLVNFLRAPITGNLLEIPGVGEVPERKLKNAGISTTFQLIGKYLMLKEKGVNSIEHANRFYDFLKDIGIPSCYGAGIVHCISEKMNIIFIEIYNPDDYDSL